MPRYKLTIAYDGTHFHGWQRQDVPANSVATPDAGETEDATMGRLPLRTVQHVVEQAVQQVVREPVVLLGASRTDAGVHANAQVAAFSCSVDRRGPTDDRLALAINSRLAPDALLRACEPTWETFDPISDCVSKGYRYLIHTGPERPLWERRWSHHTWHKLDIALMREAAAALVGEHDFAGFANAGHGRLTTVRTVLSCNVEQIDERVIAIDISGTGFLYNMVRIIAGTLHDVGRSRLTMNDVQEALSTGDRRRAGPTLPAKGLRLEWIKYREPTDQERATIAIATKQSEAAPSHADRSDKHTTAGEHEVST